MNVSKIINTSIALLLQTDEDAEVFIKYCYQECNFVRNYNLLLILEPKCLIQFVFVHAGAASHE